MATIGEISGFKRPFLKGHDGKTVYFSKQRAEEAVREMRLRPETQDHDRLHAYKCDHCPDYHVGRRKYEHLSKEIRNGKKQEWQQCRS